MAFQIVEIVERQAKDILVKVLHQNNEVPVTLRDVQHNDLAAGQTMQGEIDYDEILEWNVLEDFNDNQSGIWQAEDGIHLAGRIHNVLDYGGGKTIVDVYMHNGPEFFSVTSGAMEDVVFDASMGLEIVVSTLYLYPTS